MLNLMSALFDHISPALDRLSISKSDWLPMIEQEVKSPYFNDIFRFLYRQNERGAVIYPQAFDVFAAFAHCSYRKTRVVIVGPEPYAFHGEANGLAFSVPYKSPEPSSSRNLLKELQRDVKLNKDYYLNPNLGSWAAQGVLLLNTILTVSAGEPMSHKDIGWEKFTQTIIDYICLKDHPVVFLFLGDQAQKFSYLVPEGHHKIELPSPVTGEAHKGFFFSSPFTRINKILKETGMGVIDWGTVKTGRK